jgi:hypothetical protein
MKMDEATDDLMIGIRPIAEYLHEPERQAYYLAETRKLPLFKLGKLWAGRKSTINNHFEKLERDAEIGGRP